jgi:hypothetical protein
MPFTLGTKFGIAEWAATIRLMEGKTALTLPFNELRHPDRTEHHVRASANL